MDCPHIPEISYSEFGERLRPRLYAERIPASGSLELTMRCNFRCQHCYVTAGHRGLPGKTELSTRELTGILDQITEAGCLWLLITGGDPLIRRDFPEIWTYAKQKGLILTLFTNGSLLTPRLADLLAEWPPKLIEITLYGATPETYTRVTGLPGAYRRVRQAIDLLLERQLPLRLKTMVMTLNRHELRQMHEFAASLGLEFRFDAQINGGLYNYDHPKSLRLSPQEVVQLDLEYPQRGEEWKAYYHKRASQPVDRSYLYLCGAGLESFHIDPYGELSLCMLARQPSYSLRQGTFQEGWRSFLQQVRFQPAAQPTPCDGCRWTTLCNQCPGMNQLEHGDVFGRVDYLCQIAHLRARALNLHATSAV